MAASIAEKSDWVQHVLKISLGTASDANDSSRTAAPSWKAASRAWGAANDAVNDQINGLRSAILNRAGQGDGDMPGLAAALHDVADKGLNGITRNRVRLMASIQSVGDGEPASMQRFGANALDFITAFESFLDTDEKVEVCDNNPFGAPVAIRATLGPPLRQMAAAIEAALAG